VYNGFNPVLDHTVLFDDKSYNSPTSLSWTINAGNGSSYNYYTDNFEFNYSYAEPGNYSVIHSATNDAGTDSLTMLTLVNVLDTIPPASISGITNVTGSTQIKWNWTIPTDTADYDHVQVYKDGVFLANVTGNGTTWSGLTASTLYSIGTRTVDTAGNVNATWVNSSSTTLGSTWEYTTCGVTYWTAPEGVWNVTLEMIAAGGSGHPAYTSTGYYYGGWGGKAGEKVTYPKVDVIPGTNYTLVVGCKGASATYGTDSNAGTYSSAFGTTVTGGIGGLAKVSGDDDTSVGGDGEDGLGITRLAINGTTTVSGAGGISGLGRGASGGGSAANTTASPLGTGGAGADGYINITVFGYASVNLPDFSADLTSSVPGTLIHFTDESTITNGAGLTYNWSFGDGYYSSVAGDTQHVYSYTGSYDVSLTLTSSDGTATEIKYAYINIVSEPDIINAPTPMVVNFHIMYGWGTPLSDVNVTVVPISTSTGDWDWLATMFSLPTGEVQISNLSMSQTTDTFGVASFLMTSTVKYNISFTKAGYTIAPLLLVPTTSDYTQYATETGVGDPTYVHGVNELQAVSIIVSQIEVNDSYSYLNMTYSDSTGHTTGGYIDVIQKSSIPRESPTTIVRWYVTSNSESNSTLVAHPQQVDGSVQAHINNDFNTTRTYPFSMKGAPVNFMGFGAEIRLLVALGIMLLTVMLAGAATGRPIVVVMAVEGWIFYTTGFFQALIDRGTPDASIILSLVLVTVIAIAANIPYRRK
jgi:PKD repeat protein